MKTVVVDADSIIAQANKNDSNYSKATKVSRDLMKSDVEMLYPVTAISEAITVLQSKLNSLPTAIGTASVFADQNYKIIEINHELYNNAVEKYFSHVTNKNDTIFDCIVASVAEKYNADAIFSFDKFYQKLGFRLASEL